MTGANGIKEGIEWFSATECAKRAHTSPRRITRMAAAGRVPQERNPEDTKWLYHLPTLRTELDKQDEANGAHRPLHAPASQADLDQSTIIEQSAVLLRTAHSHLQAMFDRGAAYELELRKQTLETITQQRARIAELEAREREVSKERSAILDEAEARQLARDIAIRRQGMLERAVENVSKSGPDILLGLLKTFAPEEPDERAAWALELFNLNMQRTETGVVEPSEREVELLELLQKKGK